MNHHSIASLRLLAASRELVRDLWRGADLLSPLDLAARWGLSPRTLARWRVCHFGPDFCRIGRAVRYRIEDVLAFETQRCFQDQESLSQ